MIALWPVPNTLKDIDDTAPHWFPFLQDISRRSKEPVQDLFNQVYDRQVQVLLAVDMEARKTVAIAGIRLWKRGNDVIGDIVWCTGKGMKQWQHLVGEIERYLKDIGCVECRPVCRLGWSRMLKSRGYRLTHMIMEKTL